MYPKKFNFVRRDNLKNFIKPRIWQVILCLALSIPSLTACDVINIPPPEPLLIESKFVEESLVENPLAINPETASEAKSSNNSPSALVNSTSESIEIHHDFEDGIYHFVLFTYAGSNNQEQITALVNQELQSVLIESGAYHEVQTIFENAPAEGSLDRAVSAVGGNIGLLIEVSENDSNYSINPILVYPDQDLHLGEEARKNKLISEGIVFTYEQTSIAAAADYLADRLGIILNTFIGYHSQNSGDFAECTRRFNSVINLIQKIGDYPEQYGVAHASLGACLLELGRTEEARETFSAALALNPEITFANYYLGKINIEVSEFKSAQEYFLQAEKSAITDPLSSQEIEADIAASLGFIALADGRYEEAIDYFDKSLTIIPDNPKNFYNRGRAKMASNLLEAGKDFEQCLYLLSFDLESSSETKQLNNDCTKSLEQTRNSARTAQGIQVISLPTYEANFEDTSLTPSPTIPITRAPVRAVYYKVRSEFSSVNVRSGPSQDNFPVIGYLYRDDLVPVYAKTEDAVWYLIAMKDGEYGWIMSILLTTSDATPGEVPIAATVPAAPSPSSTPQPNEDENDLPFNPAPTISVSQPEAPSSPPTGTGGLSSPRSSSPPSNPPARENPPAPAPPPGPPDPGPPDPGPPRFP